MDIAILTSIYKVTDITILINFFKLITALGDHGIVILLLILFLFIYKPCRKLACLALIALIIEALLVNCSLKPLVMRARPCIVYPQYLRLLSCPTDFSFPSGHSGSTFAVAGILWFEKSRLRYPVLIFAIVVALSRLVLFVHWPSDILVGIIIGLLTAYFVHWLNVKKHFTDFIG